MDYSLFYGHQGLSLAKHIQEKVLCHWCSLQVPF